MEHKKVSIRWRRIKALDGFKGVLTGARTPVMMTPRTEVTQSVLDDSSLLASTAGLRKVGTSLSCLSRSFRRANDLPGDGDVSSASRTVRVVAAVLTDGAPWWSWKIASAV
jgi:hypothetical protein